MAELEENLKSGWAELTKTIMHNFKAELENIGDQIKAEYASQWIYVSLENGKPSMVCSDLANELWGAEMFPTYERHDFETLLKEVMDEEHEPKDFAAFAGLLTKYAKIADEILREKYKA